MTTKSFLRTMSLIIIVLLLALGLASCRKPASTAVPEATAMPVENMGPFEGAATATAVAQSGVIITTKEPAAPAAQATATPIAATQPATQPEVQPTTVPQSQPVVQPTQPPAVSEPKVYPEPTPGIPLTYTLQPGEYLYCIVRRFNLDPIELLGLNGLGPTTIVSPGTVLKIPQTGHPFVTERMRKVHPAEYTVVAGDTIYTIACAFGDVSPDMIALVNGLKAPYEISTGDKLDIP